MTVSGRSTATRELPRCERCGKRLMTPREICGVVFLPSVKVTLCPACWHAAYDYVREAVC